MTYLDTSALIKRFVSEKGSRFVQALFTKDPAVATAKIAYAEVFAALSRKLREGGLSETQYNSTCRQFERDWPSYIRVDLHDQVLVLARDLVRRHPLRGFDAIHLASALRLKQALGLELAFAAADGRLLAAARSEHLRVIHAEGASA